MDLPEHDANSIDCLRDLPAKCYGLMKELSDVDKMDLLAERRKKNNW